MIAATGHARRAVLEALIRLPADVRGLVLDRVFINVVGRAGRQAVLGRTVPRPAYESAGWTITLLAHPELRDTFGHEVAHIFGDQHVSPEAERAAAEMAASWGFRGGAADGDVCERNFEDGAARVRAVVADGVVELRCSVCSGPMLLLAPTAPGVRADLGCECRACSRVDLIGLSDIVPCTGCGARPWVEWTDEATPSMPSARWVCDQCAAPAITRAIHSPPVEPEPVVDLVTPTDEEPEWHWRVRSAGRVLGLPNGDPAWAARDLRRALASMDGAAGRQHVETAIEALKRGEVAAAIEAVAHVITPS